MRFFRLPLLALATIATTVNAASFQFQFTADNSFQVYVSPKSNPTFVQHLENFGTKQQDEWTSPTIYEDPVELFEGDVVSVYMHNIIDVQVTDPTANPSAIVGRLVQIDPVANPVTFVTNDKDWLCAWRHEVSDDPNSPVTKYDPTRYDTSTHNWAMKSFDALNTFVNLLPGQSGSNTFHTAVSLGELGGNNFWHSKGFDKNVITAMGGTNPGPTWADPATRPQWIHGFENTHSMPSGDILAHHAWCRFTVPKIGNAGGSGDPQFTGFQGQSFQFHGLPDEHFNLISSPSVQLNAHFVYISAGTCDYTETPCWTHPGTYMDVLGFTIAETQVKIAAGPHHAGLRIWSNGTEIVRGESLALSNYTDATLTYTRDGRVHIETEAITYQIVNSDSFLNFDATLNDQTLLSAGRAHHSVTDQTLCKENYADSGDYRTVEKMVAEKYHVQAPIHGLVGQTWRNVKICGRDWMGTIEDYLVSSLFASDYHYNYFNF